MDERDQYLNRLAEAAKSGNASALAALSSIALGGNAHARIAIHEIDKQPAPRRASGEVKAIVWSKEIEDGQRGPMLGDVPLHNDL